MPARSIHFVSLGCPKNRVDSEVMLGVAERAGYRQVPDPAAAEVIVVNTCGFIGPAKQESVETILALAEHKSAGSCRQLVVTGCLAQRYSADLARELPEVDHFLGSSDMLRLGQILEPAAGQPERVMIGDPASWLMSAADPRTLSTTPGSAYLKIADGCDRSCSFCIIPELRGRQRSRPPDDLLREAEALAAAGVRELNLISQDTSAYGRDLPAAGGKPTLGSLVARLAEVAGLAWIRLLYLYPEPQPDPKLIELLAHHPRVLPYVDLPLQHVTDRMLRRMRRGHTAPRIHRLIAELRHAIPDLTIRSAFITGHPGETPEDFEKLCDFVRQAELEHVGVFRYSDEEGTRSYALAGKISPLVAANRCRRLMAIARRLARAKNRRLIGRRLEVLVEGPSDEHELVLMGRHAGQAPEIDGQIYLSGTERLPRLPRPGELWTVTITQASDYDLVGEVEASSGLTDVGE